MNDLACGTLDRTWASVEQKRVWEQARLIDRYTKPTEQTASR